MFVWLQANKRPHNNTDNDEDDGQSNFKRGYNNSNQGKYLKEQKVFIVVVIASCYRQLFANIKKIFKTSFNTDTRA